MDEEAKRKGISAIVGGGESPGITNVMCYLGAEGMSSVDSAKILVGAEKLEARCDISLFSLYSY